MADLAFYGVMIFAESILWLVMLTFVVLVFALKQDPLIPKLCGPALFISGCWCMRIRNVSGAFIRGNHSTVYRSYRWIRSLEDEDECQDL